MSYRSKFDKIKNLESRPRGFAFEKLINKIFDDAGVLISKSYKTADGAQQIDGAVEIKSRIFLLEAKWEESDTLAASKLYSFVGKINSKIVGTLGIFISYNRLKDNFINAVRDGLKQNCIIIHGEENINGIIDQEIKFDEFVWYCFQQASMKSRVDITTSEFKSISIAKSKTRSSSSPEEKWKSIYKYLTNTSSLQDFSSRLEVTYSEDIELSQKILNLYPSLEFNHALSEKFEYLIKKLLMEENSKFSEALYLKLKSNYWREYSKERLINLVKNSLTLSKLNRQLILTNITKDFSGDWEIENDASKVIEIFYDNLENTQKELLAEIYLNIYCDTVRNDRFPQKQFAKQLFDELAQKEKDIFELVSNYLLNDIKERKNEESIWKGEDDTPEVIKKWILKDIRRKYKKVFDKSKKDLESILSDEYDRL